MSAIRVLSIQSHVVHGYVGNRCTSFALQIHGADVDIINSVQLSNHTGYSTWTGEAVGADQIWELYQGLIRNDLTDYTHVVTGYINEPSVLSAVEKIVRDLKIRNPSIKYFCDPVLGDLGKLYPLVPREMVDIYRDRILALAHVVKLNQTELEHLVCQKITCLDHVLLAIDKLHQLDNIAMVVVSSVFLEKDKIMIIGSKKTENSGPNASFQRYLMTINQVKENFIGTGDLFTSLLLVWTEKKDFSEAIRYTVSALQDVINVTVQQLPTVSLKFKEIKLVQSREFLLNPTLLDPPTEIRPLD
ncbi:pyridoxal kinase-like [Schistocerca gregaria]|uniref:pyridoxal kinase-like n=1 Tax=Schistocerca gregaria TaxID=7010 RepID=UPI00211EEE12|nr:pyridoxal kinase-like [Schistocerca gregaria]